MPTLLIAMTFFAFAQFLGSIYSANKKTGMAFVTNLIGVIVNVSLNFILIKYFSVLGCAIATAVSYFVLWVSRAIDTKKIVAIKHKPATTVIAVLILCLQCVLVSSEAPYAYLISIIGLIILLAIFFKTFKELVMFALSILKRFLKKGAQNG
jgi:O-antigen/teichoic acid export membrane protein